MTLKEAEKLALKVLKQVMEEKLNSTNVQLASVTPKDGYKILPPELLEPLIAEL